MRTIMFTHNDLDGVGCGILHKVGFGVTAETYYCGYHNVDEKIQNRLEELKTSNELPMIIISDLGITEETAEMVDKYEGKKILLDHHVTNEWIAEKYDWAIVDKEASGTLLVFNQFDEIPRNYLDFALHVDDYDRWVHNLLKSKDLNRLLYIVGIERFEERFLYDDRMDFNHSELLLLELEQENIERYVDKVEKGLIVRYLNDDKRFGVAFADRYQSEVAHELMNRMNLEAIALIDVNFKKISFRSKSNIHVGEIAKRFKGGGHKNAAGVSFAYEESIEDFNGNKYPLLGVYQNLVGTLYELSWKFKQTYEEIENEAISQLFVEGDM